MKVMKLNLNFEMIETAAIALALGARPVRQTVSSAPAVATAEPRPPAPAWIWGFSPMLPWGTLKEGQ